MLENRWNNIEILLSEQDQRKESAYSVLDLACLFETSPLGIRTLLSSAGMLEKCGDEHHPEEVTKVLQGLNEELEAVRGDASRLEEMLLVNLQLLSWMNQQAV